MPSKLSESRNALCHELLLAVTDVDLSSLKSLCTEDVLIDVPGARDVDLTTHSRGTEALCLWAQSVHNLCGKTTFSLHRYFENGCELMAVGEIHIERHPRIFVSACAIHLRFEAGQIALFQLLLDTYALEKFRGQMD